MVPHVHFAHPWMYEAWSMPKYVLGNQKVQTYEPTGLSKPLGAIPHRRLSKAEVGKKADSGHPARVQDTVIKPC